MSYCKFLWGNPCKAIETFHHWDLPLGLRVLDGFRSFCCMKEFGHGFGCVIFARLLTSWRKLQLSLSEHCPLDSHCQKSPRILLYTLFCPLILDHGVSLIISTSGAKIFYFVCLARYFFSPLFSICDNQVITSSDESPGHTIPIRSWVFSDSRILNLYNPSKMSSCGIFVIDNKISSHLESNQVSHLSAAKVTVLLLGLLFLQTDSSFEVGIMDDVVQCWSGPRIKYFKIRPWCFEWSHQFLL